MNKLITLMLALAAAPLMAHDEVMMKDASGTAKPMMMEGMMRDASGTAKPMMKGKMKKMKMKKGEKIGAKVSKEATPDAKGTTVAAHHEHWVCPMGDGGESDHAGKCPKCGMDLVLEKEDKK